MDGSLFHRYAKVNKKNKNKNKNKNKKVKLRYSSLGQVH
jgi:hypothetical protein